MNRCEMNDKPCRPGLQKLVHLLGVMAGGVVDDQVQHLFLGSSAINQVKKIDVFLVAVSIC